MSEPTKIISIEASNFKRLRAVHVKLDTSGSLVVVSGRNAQGKSSLLDAVETLIRGGVACPEKPLRRGAKNGRLDGELSNGWKIHRTITENGLGQLVITDDSENGAMKSPQAMLDALYGRISFDPLALLQMKPAERLNLLKTIVGLDFSAMDADRARLYTEREAKNREYKSASAAADQAPHHDNAPGEETPISELLEDRRRRNAVNENNRATRESLDEATQSLCEIRNSVKHAADSVIKVNAALDQELTDINSAEEREIARIRADAAKQRDAATARTKKLSDEWHERGRELLIHESEAQDRVVQLSGIVDGLKDADADEIENRIASAESNNAKARDNAAHARLKIRAKSLGQESETMSRKIEDIDEKKRAALESAKFPVPGLSFSDGDIELNGLPFSQASAAEQLRLSTAIGIATHKAMPVMLIRNGSLLDFDGMKLLSALAEEHNAQILVETVSDGDGCGICIEDGSIVETKGGVA